MHECSQALHKLIGWRHGRPAHGLLRRNSLLWSHRAWWHLPVGNTLPSSHHPDLGRLRVHLVGLYWHHGLRAHLPRLALHLHLEEELLLLFWIHRATMRSHWLLHHHTRHLTRHLVGNVCVRLGNLLGYLPRNTHRNLLCHHRIAHCARRPRYWRLSWWELGIEPLRESVGLYKRLRVSPVF